MTERKFSKRSLIKTFLRCFFAVMLPITGVMGILSNTTPVFADELEDEEMTVWEGEDFEPEMMTAEREENETTEQRATENKTEKKDTETEKKDNKVDGQNCFNALGEVGWLVCPGTGKIANAVDWLYGKIEGILQINPIKMQDGEPIYEIWKYCKGITNIVFVIFMLIVIYSQITGVGISNYGLKKAMPKLIIAAILVNLSFLLCSLLVDVSNIIGSGLRGVFTSVEQTVMGSMNTGMSLKMTEVYQSLAGGTAIAVGAAAIAFETGTIWMLIPVALGAIVAVATGLITIALRQAVVMILIMISPLAVVAYILPNTEQLFEKWKKLLIRMLVFYPVFSLLFGASSLAGFAIITGSKDGFGVLLGIAVQIFPLFFSWKLMRMSGTILGTINEKIRDVASKPLAPVGNWANSHRELSKQKHLASGNIYTPSRYLTQFLSNRRVAREAEITEHAEVVKERGLAYNAMTKYHRTKDGNIDTTRLSRDGEQAYNMQARRMTYARTIALDKNNFNKGFGAETEDEKYNARINALNKKNVDESDALFVENVRGEKIEYDNAKGRYKRFEAALDAGQDRAKLDELKTGKIKKEEYAKYKEHFNDHNSAEYKQAIERYDTLTGIMGKVDNIHYFGAAAAASYGTQTKVFTDKYNRYFDMLPPTKDVMFRLGDLTTSEDSSEYIDAIIPGLRVLNTRGDTDLIREQIINLTDKEKLKLGTHASQALASFLMFDVKDNDPSLRRFGKYINLETAAIYNENKRKKMSVDLKEYVLGKYYEKTIDDSGAETLIERKSKKDMVSLLEGTSFDNVERTAFANYDSLIKYAYDIPDGDETKIRVADPKNFEAYMKRKGEVDKSIGAAFISASMKYLSGSEQLTSAVKFITGYTTDDDGKIIGVWDKEYGKIEDQYKNKLDNTEPLIYKDRQRDELEKFYRNSTYNYLDKQTSTQILGLRSDYQKPLIEHLFGMFLDNEMIKDKDTGKSYYLYRKGWTDEMDEERDALISQYVHADNEKDKEELKQKMAAAQFQNMLAVKGKLKQIHDSKRSGAANNAKDWVREMVGLNDPNSVSWKLKKLKKQNEENKKIEAREFDSIPYGILGASNYQSQLNEFLSRNRLRFDSTSREDFVAGLKRFADEVVNSDEFDAEFDDFYNNASNVADNETMYEGFCSLLAKYFEDN